MALLKDRAIVLRRLDYSETSQVVAVFTLAHGQQRLIAKGIKRGTRTRAAVGLDLLELGDMVFSRRAGSESHLSTLVEWRQRDAFPHLRRSLAAAYAAQYAAEATSVLTEADDPHPALFEALRAFLQELKIAPPAPTLCTYLRRLLTEIGLCPRLRRCAACARPVEGEVVLYYSQHEGGVLCRDCEPPIIEKRRVDPAVVGFLDAIDAAAPSDGGGATEREGTAGVPVKRQAAEKISLAAFELLDYHLAQLLGRRLRLSEPLGAALRNA